MGCGAISKPAFVESNEKNGLSDSDSVPYKPQSGTGFGQTYPIREGEEEGVSVNDMLQETSTHQADQTEQGTLQEGKRILERSMANTWANSNSKFKSSTIEPEAEKPEDKEKGDDPLINGASKPGDETLPSAGAEAQIKQIMENTAGLDKELELEEKLRKNAEITNAEVFDPDKFRMVNGPSNTGLQPSVPSHIIDVESPKLSPSHKGEKSNDDWKGTEKSFSLNADVNSTSHDIGLRKSIPGYEGDIEKMFLPNNNGGEDPLLDSQDELMMEEILAEQKA
ncbi:hypothetical protein AAMO2058_000494100 [Amorphochlora amoebiformis]